VRSFIHAPGEVLVIRISRVWRAAIALALVIVAAVPAGAAAFSPGSAGAGDPFFPLAGNGGYDVANYTLDFDYNPQNNALDAVATVSATATQDLSSFHLDFPGTPHRQRDARRSARGLRPAGPGARDHARCRDQ
jgi:hypothetical protein